MSDSRDARVDAALAEYLAANDAGLPLDRAAFLARYPDLANSLTVFLDDHERMRAAADPEATIAPAAVAAPLGTLRYVGDYELLEEFARGGMGVVYRARHRVLDRSCAIKMIRSANYADSVERQRFQIEARAVARLQHPHIVQIFEVGEHDNLPFMALEYCSGGSLDQRLTHHPLSPREAATLVRTLAEAVHAAHQAGVLHRDIKPSNVLLTETGLPKITDFGLAQVNESMPRTELTQSGAIVGTPSYMPPEQAEGQKNLGPAADVYALGALLYCCLTGRPPFLAATSLDTLLQVLHEEPVPLRQLNPNVPRDLATICQKCIQKQPSRRYADAQDLAADLGRFMEGRPILARPVGMLERGTRWVHRNPVVATLAAAILILVATGVSVAFTLATVANQERVTAQQETLRARAAEKTANANLVLAQQRELETLAENRRGNAARHALQMELAARAWSDHDLNRTDRLLNDVPVEFRDNWETRYLRALHERTAPHLRGHQGWAMTVCFSPNGTRAACASYDGTVRVWDTATWRTLHVLDGHTIVDGQVTAVESVAFSPDGKTLVSASWDRTLKLWNVETGQVLRTFAGHLDSVKCVAFSPDGKQLASCSRDETVRLWEVATGRTIRTFTGHDHEVHAVAFSPDGLTLATASFDRTARLWDIASGAVRHILKGHTGFVNSVSFSPDGKTLATGGDQTVRLWDAQTGQPGRILTASGRINAVTFHPDGTFLAGAGGDAIRIWYASSGHLRDTLTGHQHWVMGVCFSPDGKRLLSSSVDRTLRVWDLEAKSTTHALVGHTDAVNDLTYSPDGKILASTGRDRAIRLWNPATGQLVRGFTGHESDIRAISFSPEGRFLVTAGGDATIRVWNSATGKETKTFREAPNNAPHRICFSPDGKTLASTHRDQEVRLWDLETGRQICSFGSHREPVLDACFSPDGQRLVSSSQDRTLKVWETATGRLLRTLEGHTGGVTSVAFSPDGTRIASAVRGDIHDRNLDHRELKLWDAATYGEIASLPVTGFNVTRLTFSPDSKTLATGGDGAIKLWDVGMVQERFTLPNSGGVVWAVRFSPDGKSLAGACNDGTVRLWYAP